MTTADSAARRMTGALWSRGAAVRQKAVRTPDIRQAEAAECGLAALAIVLGHYGANVTLEALRCAAGPVRNGATARDLARLAAHHGFTLRAVRAEPETLAALEWPAILHWRFNHFVVLEAVGSGGCRLNDPAGGPRLARPEEVDEDFTGVALLVRPGPGARAFGRPFALWRTGLALASRRPLHAALLGATTLMAGLSCGLAARQAAGLIDGQAPPGAAMATIMLAPLAFGLMALAADGFAAAIGVHATERALTRLRTAPSGFFWQRAPDAVAGLPRAAGDDAAAAPVLILADLGLIALMLAGFATLDPRLALFLALSLGTVLALAAFVLLRRGSPLPHAVAAEPRPVTPGVRAIAMLIADRTGGRDGELFGQLAGTHAARAESGSRARPARLLLHGVRTGLGAFALTGGLAIAALGLRDGWTSPGQAVAAAGLTLMLVVFIAQLETRLARLPASRAALIAWSEVARAASEPASGPQPAWTPRGALVFAGVAIEARPGLPQVLAGVDLSLAPGEQAAVVGPSGSGKTLLLRLASGLVAPQTGEVLIDGAAAMAVASARPGAISHLGRASAFVHGSLRENLALGPSAWSDQALQAILSEVRLDHELATRGGLDLIVSHGAPELSGGQRVRLALARALLREPVLICLDGVLDKLDDALDAHIRAGLRQRGCTVLLVSRRETTRAGCDRIIALAGPGEALALRRPA